MEKNQLRKIFNVISKELHPPHSRRILSFKKEFLCRNMVLGGTFDRLHIGHKTVITTALEITEMLHICVMSDEAIKRWMNKKNMHKLRNLSERLKGISKFIEKINAHGRVKLSVIEDPYSYAVLSDIATELDAILITTDTGVIRRADELNKKRVKKKLQPLEMFQVPLIIDKDGSIISSSALRTGKNFLYEQLIQISDVFLTEEARKLAKLPIGKLVKSIDEIPYFPDVVIVVGDFVLATFVERKIPISIGIIDRKTKRVPTKKEIYLLDVLTDKHIVVPHIPLTNRRSTINKEAWVTIALAMLQKNTVIVRVFGEEDLLAIPAILLAPKNSLVVYGQPPPNEGLVYQYIDDEIREKALNLLLKMEFC